MRGCGCGWWSLARWVVELAVEMGGWTGVLDGTVRTGAGCGQRGDRCSLTLAAAGVATCSLQRNVIQKQLQVNNTFIYAPCSKLTYPLILANCAPQYCIRPYQSDIFQSKQTPPIPLIRVGRHVVPSLRVNQARRHKVLVEVVHVLERVALHRTRDDDIVDRATALVHQSSSQIMPTGQLEGLSASRLGLCFSPESHLGMIDVS